MKQVEIYRVEKRKGRFFENFFLIVVSVLGTLWIEKGFIQAKQIEQEVQKLSYQEQGEKQDDSKTKFSEENVMDISSLLESTVGISIVKPNGENVLDVDVEKKWGLGTGMIVSQEGYILTNQHLAKRVGSSVFVTLHSGKTLPGRIVWTEEHLDLAILKINESNLPAIKMENGQSLKLRGRGICNRKSTRNRI